MDHAISRTSKDFFAVFKNSFNIFFSFSVISASRKSCQIVDHNLLGAQLVLIDVAVLSVQVEGLIELFEVILGTLSSPSTSNSSYSIFFNFLKL